jgi:hypothetical protein
MISLAKAIALKQVGLEWRPYTNDFFAIPERDLDDRIFVISDMLAMVDVIQNMQFISFQGASEWALDSLVTEETVWMPRDDQLLSALEAALISKGYYSLFLKSDIVGYVLQIQTGGEKIVFSGKRVSEVYADALLDILKKSIE